MTVPAVLYDTVYARYSLYTSTTPGNAVGSGLAEASGVSGVGSATRGRDGTPPGTVTVRLHPLALLRGINSDLSDTSSSSLSI